MLAVAGLFLLASQAVAQEPTRYAVFGGYSTRADIVFTPVNSFPISIPNVARLNGWNGSFERRLFRFIGAVGDASGHYGSYGASAGCEAILVCVPINGTINSGLYSILVGPQSSFSVWRLRPFAHALFGVAHINHKANLIALEGLSNSATSFADAIGGGIDIRIVKKVSWRFQADLLQTRFFGFPAPLDLITGSENGFRGSLGVVVRF